MSDIINMTESSYNNKIRRYKMKLHAINLLGGKCMKCSWSGNIAAFHFHHRNPAEKTFGISGAPITCWEKYWDEVQKCDLLCAICHNIIHSDYINEKFLEDVKNYNGRELISSNIPWKNQTHLETIYNKICPYCCNSFKTSIKNQKYCSIKCKDEIRRKCKRPSKEELERMLEQVSTYKVAKAFGVSETSVRKWVRKYNLLASKL